MSSAFCKCGNQAIYAGCFCSVFIYAEFKEQDALKQVVQGLIKGLIFVAFRYGNDAFSAPEAA